jgi:hypothetical protein
MDGAVLMELGGALAEEADGGGGRLRSDSEVARELQEKWDSEATAAAATADDVPPLIVISEPTAAAGPETASSATADAKPAATETNALLRSGLARHDR